LGGSTGNWEATLGAGAASGTLISGAAASCTNMRACKICGKCNAPMTLSGVSSMGAASWAISYIGDRMSHTMAETG